MKKFIIFILTLFAFSLVSCQKPGFGPDRPQKRGERGNKRGGQGENKQGGQRGMRGSTASVCKGKNDLSQVPVAF